MGRIGPLPLWGRLALLAGALVLAGAVWTLAASLVLLLGTGLFRFYPHPSTQWFLYFPYRNENARLGWWITTSAGIATLAVLPALARVVWDLFLRRLLQPAAQRKPLYGETEWASPSTAKRAGFDLKRHL